MPLTQVQGQMILASGQSIPKAALPTGSVLQVVQAVKTDTFSTTSMTFTDVTGLSVSITPTSSTSKILVMANTAVGSNQDFAYTRLMRDSTAIYIGDAASNRPRVTNAIIYAGAEGQYNVESLPIMYLDSPATTSATTYKIQIRSGSSPTNTYINRTASDRDTVDYEARTASSIIVMEIAA